MEASLGPRRTAQDVTAHMARTVARDPEGVWGFVVDRLNLHQSASLVDGVAAPGGVREEVREVRAHGGLQAMASRTTGLAEVSHRITLVSTPTQTSWLNQGEMGFSMLVRRARKRGNVPSLEALRERIVAFIEYYNQTAQPFQWTSKGRPLVISPGQDFRTCVLGGHVTRCPHPGRGTSSSRTLPNPPEGAVS